jgi:hypothetical protein
MRNERVRRLSGRKGVDRTGGIRAVGGPDAHLTDPSLLAGIPKGRGNCSRSGPKAREEDVINPRCGKSQDRSAQACGMLVPLVVVRTEAERGRKCGTMHLGRSLRRFRQTFSPKEEEPWSTRNFRSAEQAGSSQQGKTGMMTDVCHSPTYRSNGRSKPSKRSRHEGDGDHIREPRAVSGE